MIRSLKVLNTRWWVLFFIIFTLFTSYFYYQKALSLHFVDEEHNIVLGNFLLKGEKMYEDIFNNHQPLAPIISAGIQKTTDSNSIYLLIKRHREFMIFWTLVWATILIIYFSYKIVPFIVFFELSKIVLLGNLFLSESLIIYPLIFLIGVLINDKNIRTWEYIFIGAIFTFITFTFAPIWPVILALFFVLIAKHLRANIKNYLFFLSGVIPVLTLILNFSSITDYFFDTFYINSKYFIPYGVENNTDGITILSFITPILSFLSQNQSSSKVLINIISLLLIIVFFLLIKNKKYLTTFLIFLILGLANIRYINPSEQFYRGFHLLPWFALLLFFASFHAVSLYKQASKKTKTMLILLMTMGLVQSLNIAQQSLFKLNDSQQELYINYSKQFDSGIIVKSIKLEGETMLISPDEWLIYWQADITHPKKLVNFYEWMIRSPELKFIVDDSFANNPPTYVYCDCPESSYLYKYLNRYQKIKKHGGEISLYILDNKLKSLSSEQRQRLKFYGVELKEER